MIKLFKCRHSLKMMLLYGVLALGIASCIHSQNSKAMDKNKKPDPKSLNGYYIVTAEIVKKQFYNKAGKAIDRYEYYVRRSIKDYFIKFCESKVSKEQIDQALDQIKDNLHPVLNLEVEFVDGLWDQCSDEQVQSRVGEYVVVHSIVE